MWTSITAVLVLASLKISLIRAQEYAIVDDQELNIWTSDESQEIDYVQTLLTSLCDNYDMAINDNKIDCTNIKLSTKQLNEDVHVKRKRNVGENELEGSGAGNAEDISENINIAVFNLKSNESLAFSGNQSQVVTLESTISSNLTLETNESIPEENDKIALASVNLDKNATLDNAEILSLNQTSQKKTEPQKPSLDSQVRISLYNKTDDIIFENVTVEAKNSKNLIDMENMNQNNTGEPISVAAANGEPSLNETQEVNKTQVSSAEHTRGFPPLLHAISTEESVLPQKNSNANSSEITETPDLSSATETLLLDTKENNITKIISPEKEFPSKALSENQPTKVLPSDLAEVDKKEIVDDQQSANAVLLKEPKNSVAVQVEGSESDKALAKMAANAEISKNPQPEQPNTGESTKDVAKASKDTTILIVLFVVVIAIGTAAFAHNYIKKRKQKAIPNTNNTANGRSLENLSTKNNDIEQGTELKPLMKDKDGNSTTMVKEYSDKKEVQA